MSNTYYISYVRTVENRHHLFTETWENQENACFAHERSEQLYRGEAHDAKTDEAITNVISSWYNINREIAEAQAIKVAKDKLGRIKAAQVEKPAEPVATPAKETKWVVSWVAKKQTHKVTFSMKDMAEETAEALRASGHKANIEEV